MLDLIREAPVGQALRLISRNRLLQYPEERPDFELPSQYVIHLKESEKPDLRDHDSLRSNGDIPAIAVGGDTSMPAARRPGRDDIESLGMVRSSTSVHTAPYSNERVEIEKELELERTKTIPIAPQVTSDGVILVDW